MKLYWYEYRLRGGGPGCQPKGFKQIDHTYGRHGRVAYERKLSAAEMEAYDLEDLNKSERQLAYEDLKYKLLQEGDMDQINPENMLLLLDYIDELRAARD